ncbi:molybdopterin-dependent oxidoreductase [Profundibacter sp.]
MSTLHINGSAQKVTADPARRLSEVLREDMGLRGTKVGCNAGDCGACTVLLDGAPVCACLTTLAQAEGKEITTVEGLNAKNLQAAFLHYGAAQCGICTPGMLMAAAALLRDHPHPDKQQVEDALGGVLCRCTGYTKIIQAVMHANNPLPDPVNPKAGCAVGSAVVRLDGQPKVDGTEAFGADHVPPDCLTVHAIRSPHHRAGFSIGDTVDWVLQNAGIEMVLTAADIEGENRFGVIPPFADQPALAQNHTRFRGEAVALIVGEAGAVETCDLAGFPITWTPQPETMNTDSAMLPDAPQLHEGREGNLLIAGLVRHGDWENRLENSTHIAQTHIETSYVEHAYIEPEAGVAWMDGDTLNIRACTQAPVMDQEEVAKILALPMGRVRIIPSATGGGFGSKLDVSVQPLIGLAAMKTGKACRMTYTRSESMSSTTKRHPAKMSAHIGCDAQGRLTAMHFDGDFNTGAYASWGPTVANRVPVHASGPYKMPAYFAAARAIHTNGPPSGAFRGFGVPQAAIIQEILFDDLAIAAGIDRLEFRQNNALRDGDRTQTGQLLTAVGIGACLGALVDPWQQALADNARWNAAHDHIKRGVGVASCWYGCGNTSLPNPSTILAGITPDGQLTLHQGATDIGQGSNTVIAQIFADALGLPLSQITLLGPDTGITPDAGKTSASRQTYVSGKAAEQTGRALRASILQRLNLGEDAPLTLDGGYITSWQSRLELGALAVDEHGYALSAISTYDPPTAPLDADGQGTPYAVYGYGAQMAQIEIDTRLGTVNVRHIHAAHDLGRVINPVLATGQIEGGIAQGLGMALMEEYIPGRTENLHDYLIPTIGDMPEITCILIEDPDPHGPFGAKGLGEHVLIPTAPAILNAIRDATGARITRLPALPYRVLNAIVEAKL